MRYQYVQDVGEGKYGSNGLINPRVAAMLSREIPTIPREAPAPRPQRKEESIGERKKAVVFTRPIFKANEYLNELETRLRSSTGGANSASHLRFASQEQNYLLEAKR